MLKYRVSLKLPDKTQTKIRPTIKEGLEALDLPTFFKSKGTITVAYGKLKAEVWMWPHALRKLFTNPVSKELLQKRLMSALK